MTMLEPRKGEARSPGATYQQLLDADTHAVPDVLRWTNNAFIDDADVSVSRYTSREFHELEKEKVWKRVWQMACRLEEIPAVGDWIEYRILDKSVILVRTEQGVKAFHNACTHRGIGRVGNNGRERSVEVKRTKRVVMGEAGQQRQTGAGEYVLHG